MLSKIEEIKLIARCVAVDDRRAFGRLVDACQADVRGFLATLAGGDVCLADDLAQETFLKAYSGLRSFRGAARFRTWLFTIAAREYYSYLRRRREEHLPEALPDVTEAPGQLGVDASLDFRAALARLSPEDRGIVVLRYWRDMPVREIARAAGMSESVVKTRLHRARARMAEFLENN